MEDSMPDKVDHTMHRAEELKKELEQAQQRIKELENIQTKNFGSWPTVERIGMALAVGAALVPIGALLTKAVKNLSRTHTVVEPEAKELLYDYALAKAKEERERELHMRMHEIMGEVEDQSPEHLAERYAKALRDEQERKARGRAERKIVDAVKKSTTTNGSELKDEI